MTDQPVDSGKEQNPNALSGDAELSAIQTVLGVLVPLQDDQRQRVIDYVFQRLGLVSTPTSTSPAQTLSAAISTPANAAPNLGPGVSIRDVRSLKDQKKPRSANEMAALVAYYLSELAPVESRKAAIGTDDIVTYFKQAGYPLPAVLRNTLANAKASGYFDSAAHGLYKLNPVGHNLVVHGLPPDGKDGAQTNRGARGPRKSPGSAARHK